MNEPTSIGAIALPGIAERTETRTCNACKRPFEVTLRSVRLADGGEMPFVGPTDCGACIEGLETALEEHRRAERAKDVARCLAEIPEEFTGARADDPQVAEWVRALLAGSRRSLVLLGNVGVGKTHQAWGIWRTIAEHDPSSTVSAWRASRLLLEMHTAERDIKRDVVTRLEDASLLILDDLGESSPTDSNLTIWAEIVDARYARRRPLVATTNCTAEELETRLGARTFSRLLQRADFIQLTGPDRRRA